MERRVSIIVPTITGREGSLERCLQSYGDHAQYGWEIVIVKDEKNWPAACNVGAAKATGDILHFSADDLEAIPGWFQNVPLALGANVLPAPRVWDYVYDGPGRMDDGPDGMRADFPRIPTMTREQYDRIGPWPEIDYYADCWLGDVLYILGWTCLVLPGYRFVHHWNQTGRLDSPERLAAAREAYEHERALTAAKLSARS